MNLYRFRGYGAELWIAAPTFHTACETVDAEGMRWREVELFASDEDSTWPAGTPKKRLIVLVSPAAPDKYARIAELERELAELTAEKDAAIAAEVKRAQEAERERDKFSADLHDEVRRKRQLKEQLRELTQAARPFALHAINWACGDKLRAVLDAQSKKEVNA